MLSEHNTEFFDKILYILFIYICEELICSNLPWKTASSKVTLVHTA